MKNKDVKKYDCPNETTLLRIYVIVDSTIATKIEEMYIYIYVYLWNIALTFECQVAFLSTNKLSEVFKKSVLDFVFSQKIFCLDSGSMIS